MTLKKNDLKDTILPKISIDEYEPKSGTVEEVIVVGFYVIDEDPAHDLDGFLERGTVEILDADVSPNPDEDGNYLVFIEFLRNKDFFIKFFDILKDIKNVAGEMDWIIYTTENEDGVPITDKSWRSEISARIKQMTAESFFSTAYITDMLVESSVVNTYPFYRETLTIRDALRSMQMEVVDFGDMNTVVERNNISNTASNLMESSADIRKLRAMLGGGWHVTDFKDKIAINNDWDNQLLLVRMI